MGERRAAYQAVNALRRRHCEGYTKRGGVEEDMEEKEKENKKYKNLNTNGNRKTRRKS